MAEIKSLILAAGFGTRMQPITDIIPKPMIPFMGKPLLEFALDKLIAADISSVAVNSHHKPDQIEEFLKKNHPNCQVSHETTILGTGGAIVPLKDWIGGHDLLIFNSDIICDVNLKNLVEYHQAQSQLATMLLLKQADTSKTPIAVDQQQLLRNFGEVPDDCSNHSFTGIHIISNQMIQMLPEGCHSIIDTYKTCLANGQSIGTLLYDGFWRDLGTPKDFWQAHRDLTLEQMGMDMLFSDDNLTSSSELGEPRVCSKQVVIGKDVQINGDVFLFGGTTISEGSLIQNSIVIDAHVPSQAQVINQILYKQVSIPIPQHI